MFSADGVTLNYFSSSGLVIAWDIPSGRRTTLADVAFPTGIALDSSARWLAVSRGNRTLDLWDLSQQETAAEPLVGHFGNVEAADFSPDARRLASIAEGHAMVWDVATHRPIGQCSWGAAGGAAAKVALSPDGAIVAMAASDDPTIGLCFAPDR